MVIATIFGSFTWRSNIPLPIDLIDAQALCKLSFLALACYARLDNTNNNNLRFL